MSKSGLGLGISLPMLSAILVLAITQNFYAAAAMFIIAFAYGICTLFSLIPVIGIIIQWYLLTAASSWLSNILPSLPGNALWITNAVFWINVVFGIILNIYVILFIIYVFFIKKY